MCIYIYQLFLPSKMTIEGEYFHKYGKNLEKTCTSSHKHITQTRRKYIMQYYLQIYYPIRRFVTTLYGRNVK